MIGDVPIHIIKETRKFSGGVRHAHTPRLGVLNVLRQRRRHAARHLDLLRLVNLPLLRELIEDLGNGIPALGPLVQINKAVDHLGDGIRQRRLPLGAQLQHRGNGPSDQALPVDRRDVRVIVRLGKCRVLERALRQQMLEVSLKAPRILHDRAARVEINPVFPDLLCEPRLLLLQRFLGSKIRQGIRRDLPSVVNSHDTCLLDQPLRRVKQIDN